MRTKHDETLTVEAEAGLLHTAFDFDDDALTIEIVNAPLRGTLVTQSDGAYTFTPDTAYVGEDSFSYRVFDGLEYSEIATVEIVVSNEVPLAGTDSFRVTKDTTLVESAPGVLRNDVDGDNEPLTIALVDGPSYGTLTLQADGSVSVAKWDVFSGVVG